ncbi:terminase small subunit [Woeseiaceae bacterium]|nr:terminase small subunit [Woeseiaceae bacterium]
MRLRAAELMGKHYGLFTERIEAVVPKRSSEEIQIELEEKLLSLLGVSISWTEQSG